MTPLPMLDGRGPSQVGILVDDFEAALVDECEKDVRQAFAAGAARVSVDFTEGRLATREDPRNPWTGAGLLPHFIELINGVMARFTADERRSIGVHTCPGGDCDATHSADVDYADLLPIARALGATVPAPVAAGDSSGRSATTSAIATTATSAMPPAASHASRAEPAGRRRAATCGTWNTGCGGGRKSGRTAGPAVPPGPAWPPGPG